MSTLLVIDDEPHIRRFVVTNLTERGYDVLEATDAEQGLELMRTHSPDLILLDIKLPGMDGWEFLDALNSDPVLSTIPVVVITGSLLSNDEAKRQYSNMADLLIKPLSVQQLMYVVRRTLNEDGSEND